MNCIFTPCLRCVPRCLPIDTPKSHREHAQIVGEVIDEKRWREQSATVPPVAR